MKILINNELEPSSSDESDSEFHNYESTNSDNDSD